MSPATVLGMMWTQAMIVPVYAVIIIVSILVHRFLASTLNMNEGSKKMHKQAMKVLFLSCLQYSFCKLKSASMILFLHQALLFQSSLPTLYFAAAALHAAHDSGLVPEWGEAGHLPPTVRP